MVSVMLGWACWADAATIYVSTNGYDPRGTSTNSIQAAVNMASGGDTIIVCDGEYRERVVVSDTYIEALPLTIEADAGASPVIKGSVDFSGDWQTNENDNMVLYEKTVPTSLLAGMSPKRIQQVFCDGVPLRRIGPINATMSALGTNINCYWYRDFGEGTNDMISGQFYYTNGAVVGTFFHDTGTDQLYVRLPGEGNPNDHQIEISNKRDVLNTTGAEHVIIRGLTFMHSCGLSYSPLHYGVVVHLGKNARLVDCIVAHGDYWGIFADAADYTVISNCVASENGCLGISIGGERTNTREENVTVQGCLVQSNNNATFCRKSVAGGIKMCTNVRALILDNEITRNRGPGLWIDKCRLHPDGYDYNVRAERNKITHHSCYEAHYGYYGYSATFVEESRHVAVCNNFLRNNGNELVVGISEHVDVCNNTVVNGVSTLGLYLWGGARAFDPALLNIEWEGTNTHARNQYVNFHNNVIYGSNPYTRFTFIQGSNGVLQVESNKCVTLDISCDYNLYYLSAGYSMVSGNFNIGGHSSYYYYTDGSPGNPTNFTAWQTNSGWDMHSIIKQSPGSAFASGGYTITTSSPCMDAGINGVWMGDTVDIDHGPRRVNGCVDIGCVEVLPLGLDSDGDDIPDWWEWQYGGNLTNMAASGDDDGDGFSNLGEWICGLDPDDPQSYFAMADSEALTQGYALSWPSSSNCVYAVQCRTNLAQGSFVNLATNLSATHPMNIYTDTTHAVDSAVFYRIRVQRAE